MKYKAIGNRISIITETEQAKYKKGLFYQYRYEGGTRYLLFEKLWHYFFAVGLEKIKTLLTANK